MYSSCELRGLFYDPLGVAGQEVTLVFFDYSYNRVRVFFTPLAGYVTAGSARHALTAYPALQFDEVEAGNVIYTRKGIVLADFDGNAVLKDFNGNDTGRAWTWARAGKRGWPSIWRATRSTFSARRSRCCTKGNTGW